MEWEHSAAAFRSPGNVHELKSPIQLAFSSCPAAYPLSSLLLQPTSSQCFCSLSGGRGTAHPCSAPWLHVGGCWLGWGDGWAPCAAEESSSCMATHGQTWYHHSTPPPALPQALTQQSAFHTVLSEPPSSFALPLARFPRALHQLGTPPRNTIFAQTSSRVGMHGRRGSQLFLLSCLWWAYFGNSLHQPPCPPASCKWVPHLSPAMSDPSAQKKANCVCESACGAWAYSRVLPSRCGPGLPWAHLLPAIWQEQHEHLARLHSFHQSGAACVHWQGRAHSTQTSLQAPRQT